MMLRAKVSQILKSPYSFLSKKFNTLEEESISGRKF